MTISEDFAIRSLQGAKVAVIIVNYKTTRLTKKCLQALCHDRELLPALRVVVVDGGSEDGSAEALATFISEAAFVDWASLLALPINGGFAWANNQAILSLARQRNFPEFLYFLNPDAEVRRGAVVALVRELQANPRCGVAGSQLLNLDESLAASAFRFPSIGRELVGAAQSAKLGRLFGVAPTMVNTAEGEKPDWVTGASFMLRTSAVKQVGLFDDGFFLYFEEVELMHRLARKGWGVCHVPESLVAHIGGASTGLGPAMHSHRLPHYWYDSRRRYFAITGGRSSLIWANLALLIGSAAASFRSIFSNRGLSGLRVRDLLRFSALPKSEDVTPSRPNWGDIPGKPPLWMTNKAASRR